MATAVQSEFAAPRRNSSLLWAFWLALASTVCNALLFAGQHAERLLVWMSLVFAMGALLLLAWGLKQFFADRAGAAHKFRSSMLAVVSALLIAVNLVGFFHARAVPASAAAPKIGQKVPEFTLPDTQNQPVSLTGLFAANAKDAPPKAVLLVFYRGYW